MSARSVIKDFKCQCVGIIGIRFTWYQTGINWKIQQVVYTLILMVPAIPLEVPVSGMIGAL